MGSSLDAYCSQRGIAPLRVLGEGHEGIVHQSTRTTAIKIHKGRQSYRQERDAYIRLREQRVTRVSGLRLPELVDFDDDLLIIEMTIVMPPYLLDFASAYLDNPPDFPEEVIADWYDDLRDRFGERFGDVIAALEGLKQAGVYLFDIHAHNLKFGPAN